LSERAKTHYKLASKQSALSPKPIHEMVFV